MSNENMFVVRSFNLSSAGGHQQLQDNLNLMAEDRYMPIKFLFRPTTQVVTVIYGVVS